MKPPQPSDAPRSLYEPDLAEDDLWFLPGPAEEAPDDPSLPPLPRADRRDATELAAWRAAQAALAVDLARAAALFGALDERLKTLGDGARQRLALMEASELSWHGGDRVAPDRLALWVSLRLAGAQDDPQALARAAWAVRRLAGGPAPGDTPDRLAAFLGRQEARGSEELTARLADWTQALAAEGLHPFTRAAWGARLWPRAGLGAGSAGLTEAHVTTARLAAGAGRGGALFLPLLLAGPQALRRDGPPEAQLARWLAGAEQATLAALLHLDRIAAWRLRAAEALADLSGRTPPRLAAVLADWPLVSAPMAEQETGASRAAAQRNLDILTERGLIREITGHGRFRMWSAKL